LDEQRSHAGAPTDLAAAFRAATPVGYPRSVWLAAALGALDRAVWAAYGWDDLDPKATNDEVVLSRLLALNCKRTAAGTDVRDT